MSPKTTNTSEEPNKSRRHCRHFLRRIPKATIALIAMGLAFWLLWNRAVVPHFTFPALTYWQGLGAILLTAFLAGVCMFAAVHRRRSAHSAASHDDRRHWGCCFGSTGKRDI